MRAKFLQERQGSAEDVGALVAVWRYLIRADEVDEDVLVDERCVTECGPGSAGSGGGDGRGKEDATLHVCECTSGTGAVCEG